MKTIGDLSRLSRTDVQKFGIKNPIETVTAALQSYQKTRDNPRRSPFKSPAKPHTRFLLGAATPPSSAHRKRAYSRAQLAKSYSTSPRKRLRREFLSPGTPTIAKVADRVKFQLKTGDGSSKICRPGEDSQPQHGEGVAPTPGALVLYHLKEALTCLDTVAQNQETDSQIDSLLDDLSKANAMVSLISTKLWKCAHTSKP